MPCHLPLTRRDTLDLGEGGLLVLGGIGTAKTTTTGAAVCRALLADSTTGLLVLIAHPEELHRMLTYIHDAHRTDDLVLFSRHRFNPLLWGVQAGYGVEQLTHLVMQALEVRGRLGEGEADGRYFLTAMQGAVRSALQLTLLAQHPPSIYSLHRVLTSCSAADSLSRVRERAGVRATSPVTEPSFSAQLLAQARHNVARARHPQARHDLHMVEEFFAFWASLNPRVRTAVISHYEAFASPFLFGETYQRTCTGVTIDPRLTHHGKILVMDIPAEESEAFLTLQILMKAAWQLATRRRRLTGRSGLSVCYADEAAIFTASGDPLFLSLARNKRASMVYIGHALPEFAATIGQTATMALLAHFRTKIFHNCAHDPETALYAARLIGETYAPATSHTATRQHTVSGLFAWLWRLPLRLLGRTYSASWSESVSTTTRLAWQVLPYELTILRTGGAAHAFFAEIIVVQSGTIWSTGANFLRATLRQDFSRPRLPRPVSHLLLLLSGPGEGGRIRRGLPGHKQARGAP